VNVPRVVTSVEELPCPQCGRRDGTHKMQCSRRPPLMDAYRASYMELRRTLATPPPGWFTFGHHLPGPVPELEFWGVGLDGDPIWERPAPTNTVSVDVVAGPIDAMFGHLFVGETRQIVMRNVATAVLALFDQAPGVRCNCGYGGVHEELNPLCDRNRAANLTVAE